MAITSFQEASNEVAVALFCNMLIIVQGTQAV